MTVENYIVGVYWGPRRESPAECAERAYRYFTNIRSVDALFARWYKTATSAERSFKWEIEVSRDRLVDLFANGLQRTEQTRAVISELGYSLWFSNLGDGGGRVNGTIDCGCASPWVNNACLLCLPTTGEATERVLTHDVLKRLLCVAIDCWDPDHGIVTSREFRTAVDLGSDKRVAGWLTYLSRRLGELPDLPDSVEVEEVAGKGTLICLSRGPWSCTQEKYVLLARKNNRPPRIRAQRTQVAVCVSAVRPTTVIDEVPGPGHPSGNTHTKGSPSRHPSPSVFRSESGGEALRKAEIEAYWKAKGLRLKEISPGVWEDPEE
jgi:hypothetical protein